MTTEDRFARNLSAWLAEDGAHRVSDHLAEVLVHSAATRQRPWWSSPERWLPVDTTLRPRPFNFPSAGRLLTVALLVLLAAAIAVFAIGSQQHRLPPPFGLARNGPLVTSHDGDIYAVDQVTAVERLLVGGDGYDFSPMYSRDGTKLVFLRSDGRPSSTPGVDVMLTMVVANADGTGVHAVTPPTKDLDWFDWSPDSTRIAYVSAKQLFVVPAVGGEPTRIRSTGPMHFPTWLPPDGKEIVYRLETTSPAIFAIAADGSGNRHKLDPKPASNASDYQGIAVAPDGKHIAFTRWPNDTDPALPSIFAVDVATGEEHGFSGMSDTGQRGTAYSPDGTRVAYARIYPTGGYELVVANADGSGNEQTVGKRRPGPNDGADIDASWAFTPDGTALLVRYGSDDVGKGYVLPLDGSPTTELGSGVFQFNDQQRLAP